LRSHEPRRSAGVWLFIKEWRALLASRAWWLMVTATGPIVGVAFTSAVATYSDLSADPGCGIACSPLLGMWAPTFGAYEIVAIFLLPFVAIRSLAVDRQSGALTLELQRRFPLAAHVAIKALAITAGWLLAFAAGVMAVGLWASYGGHVNLVELSVVLVGHVLYAVMTIAVALAIAACTDHPSTAAVVTLALTIGTWMVDFAAAIYGGWWQQVAAYTPAAFVGMFQRGLVRWDAVLAAAAISGGAIAIAVCWLRPGWTTMRRVRRTAMIATAAAACGGLGVWAPGSWDVSEAQISSFPRADVEALASISEPIRVEVHLAAQDARRSPFDRGPLAKLRRAVPDVEVQYRARTTTGLYEQADPGYGEIRYTVGGRTDASRALTDEAVVEMLLDLAAVKRMEGDTPYRGYPLVTLPAGASAIFFLLWPAACASLWLWSSWRRR